MVLVSVVVLSWVLASSRVLVATLMRALALRSSQDGLDAGHGRGDNKTSMA